MRTHYDNLHVSEKASPEVIKGAYKALAQKWHPDKHPDQREKAERYFKIITRAFEVLSDSKTRAEYDAWLTTQRKSQFSQPGPDAAQEPPRHQKPNPKPSPTPEQNMEEAREDGRRSREQGFSENDCPYTGHLAGAWLQGFREGFNADREMLTPGGVHPWRRYFARFFDTLTIPFASMFFVSFMASFLFDIDLNAYFPDSGLAWFALAGVCLVVAETFLIHHFATTPGKWLFGVSVYFQDGAKLSLNNSLERALGVTILGQAANIPGALFITNLIAYNRLKKTGSTFWDDTTKSKVECTPISSIRIFICILVTLLAVGINSIFVSMATSEQRNISRQDAQAKEAINPVLFDDPDPRASAAVALQTPVLTAEEIHFQKIYAAHPDADSVIATQRFKQWVGWSVARGKIYENGTADEVIKLLSDYKQHTVDFTEEIDSYLEHAYRMYPGLNFEGENPNQSAIEEVVNIRDQYINSGKSTLDALQMAVNSVAIKRRWKYPADSLKQ